MLIEILRVVKYLKEISFLLFNNTYFNTYILTLIFNTFILSFYKNESKHFPTIFHFFLFKNRKNRKIKKKKINN